MVREPEVSYAELRKAADHILHLLSEFMGVNTLFIAVNDRTTNFILKAFNRSEALIEEGTSLPFWETYCSLVCRDPDEALVIADTESHSETGSMAVTKALGNTAFIGVPIVLKDQSVCGTICGLDRRPYTFDEKEIDLLKTMASFLAYVVELENVAFRDGLTRAFNRNFINLYLPDDWMDLSENAAFIYADIDNFKAINDQYGHSVGDAVLSEAVQRIQRNIRRTDMVCRVGGDEFVAIVRNFEQVSVVRRILDDIIADFARPIVALPNHIQLSISLGVSLFPQDGRGIDELMEKADQAMYQVKHNGKNGFGFHTTNSSYLH